MPQERRKLLGFGVPEVVSYVVEQDEPTEISVSGEPEAVSRSETSPMSAPAFCDPSVVRIDNDDDEEEHGSNTPCESSWKMAVRADQRKAACAVTANVGLHSDDASHAPPVLTRSKLWQRRRSAEQARASFRG